MSAILPQTEITLCHNIPLSKDYANTILFTGTAIGDKWVDGRTMQNNYFKAHAKVQIPNSTYQRVNSRQIKVRGNVQSYEDCNYLMFKNPYISTAGSNPDGTSFVPSTATKYKWFYAFIDSVEYVNNSVTIITYTIDVMQTYMFDWKFKECYVEREHSVVDDVYSNITPESVDIGDDYVYLTHKFQDFEDDSNADYPNGGSLGAYLLATARVPAPNSPEVQEPDTVMINGVLCNIEYEASLSGYKNDEARNGFETILNLYRSAGQEQNIIGMGTYPAFANGVYNVEHSSSKTVDISALLQTGDTLNGIKVYNKKIFQHPYNLIMVTNNLGSTHILKPQDFNGTKFTMYGCIMPSPCVVLAPNNYRNRTIDWENSIVFNDFPLLAWGGDSYKAWWAQNQGSIVATTTNAELSKQTALQNAKATQEATKTNSIVSGGIQTLSGLAMTISGAALLAGGGSGLPMTIGGATTAANGIANIFTAGNAANTNYQNTVNTANANYQQTLDALSGNISDAKAMPNSAISLMSGNGIALATNRFGFDIWQMTIKPEYIKKVDNYFSRFGYSVKQIKVPNICVRKFFTFVKTIDCNIVPCYESGYKNADGTLSNVGYGLSASTVTQINNIFNNGITIWRYNQEDIPNWVDDTEVYARDTYCNYSLLNSDKYQNTILPENLRIVNPSDEYVPRTM